MKKIRILWTDDEVEVLKPHIMFLEEKGYEIDTCSNGNDTLDLVRQNRYDIIFLDEHMPGLSGIETLRQIRAVSTAIPVVMITKSEEEEIMEAAIGLEVTDYLIKPIKPGQALPVIKKIIDRKRLITGQNTTDYRHDFNRISEMIASASSFTDWTEIYRRTVFWELELEKSADPTMIEILKHQEHEAENLFSKFIINNYHGWLQPENTAKPILSPELLPAKVFPHLKQGVPVFFLLIDNMRLDQWRAISAELAGLYRTVEEDIYFSILPTATQFCRNTIFAGLMPSAIAETMPCYWVDEEEEHGKNNFEEKMLEQHLLRRKIDIRWTYNKIHNSQEGKKVNEKLPVLLKNDLNIMVFNFVDMLSHARTESGVIRDLATDEPAYRSLTRSWFLHSPLFELLRILASRQVKIIFSSDHGTVRVQTPVKIIGDRKTTMNLRYKTGKNLNYDPRKVFELREPHMAMLPKPNISSRYIFAINKDYFVYHNNFNHYATYYRDTFQHGGVSMQEMMIPVACLQPI
ncbi:MAG: PglZ domain-containing protein [Bacteroidales bacterium]|jgi:DNA-binding response OmpR family regulator|nr:PglZ domain-containing protein [Bacteroidales bacterium]